MKQSLLLIIFITTFFNAISIPAFQGIFNKQQPNGEIIQLSLIGDEHFSMLITPDGYPVVQSSDHYYYYAQETNGVYTPSPYIIETTRSNNVSSFLSSVDRTNLIQRVKAKRSQSQFLNSQMQKAAGFPSQGKAKGLVLLVQYSDIKFDPEHTNSTFDILLNQPNYTENGYTGSVRDYFFDQSNGVFEPRFDVIGPITLPNPMSYYGGNTNGGGDVAPAAMVIDACEIADRNFGVNFKDYDNSNTGFVDLIYVVYAGYAEAQGGPSTSIWPHAWDVRAYKNVQLDGVTLAGYACSSELRGGNGSNLDGIGTIAHEFSHCLGLPDVYDVSYSGNFGMGSWDIMAGGSYLNYSRTPAGYSAYEKATIGWIEIQELDKSEIISLQSQEESQQAYSITNPQNPNEQFIFENRQPIKWDKYLPSKGLMITHADYDEDAWLYNQVNTGENQRFTIVPADNVQNSSSQRDDLYPNSFGNNSFYINSIPSSQFYDGTFPNATISNIQLNGNLITFDFDESNPSCPENIRCSNAQHNSITLEWDDTEDAVEYQVRYQGRYLNPTIFDEDFSKMNAGSYDSPNTSNIGGKLNNYLYAQGFSGSNIYQAGGACRIGTKNNSGKLRSPIIIGEIQNNTSTISFEYTSSNKTSSPGNVVVSYDALGKKVFSSKELPINGGNDPYVFSHSLSTPDNTNYYVSIVSNNDLNIDNLKLIYNNDKNPNNTDIWKSPENTSNNYITIDGLRPNTEYRFQIRSINNSFQSDWSNTVNFSTAEPSSSTSEKFDKTIFHYSANNQLVIHSLTPQEVSIFDINGRLIENLHLSSEPTYLDLPKGVYILKDKVNTYKIIH